MRAMMELLLALSLLCLVAAFFLHESRRERRIDLRVRRRDAILRSLRGGELSGRELQEILVARGIGMSSVAFYAEMADLEKFCVRGFWKHSTIAGQPIKERWYRWESQWALTTPIAEGGTIIER